MKITKAMNEKFVNLSLKELRKKQQENRLEILKTFLKEFCNIDFSTKIFISKKAFNYFLEQYSIKSKQYPPFNIEIQKYLLSLGIPQGRHRIGKLKQPTTWDGMEFKKYADNKLLIEKYLKGELIDSDTQTIKEL